MGIKYIMIFLTSALLTMTQTHPVCDKSRCKMTSLDTYSCENADCTSIPTLTNSASIRVLKLSHNQITTVDKMNFPNLTRLELSHNAIRYIKDDAFLGCPKLQVLKLDHNEISDLTEKTLKHLDVLQELDLSFNLLTHLGDVYSVDFDPVTIILSNNKLESIDLQPFETFFNLQYVYLDSNKLNDSFLDRDKFSSLRDVKSLHLQNNSFTKLPSKLFADFNIGRLYEVDFSMNKITEIANDTFANGPAILDNLRKIELRKNKLSALQNGTFALPALQDLYLDGNSFTELRPEFFDGCSARKISIQGCNQLKAIINGTFSNMHKVQYIDVSDCSQLSLIESDAFGSSTGKSNKLETVVLSTNHLTTLKQETLNWTKVTVDLSFNPWSCDCKLEWMAEIHLNLMHREDTKCASPVSLRERRVDEVPFNLFLCKHSAWLSDRRFTMILAGSCLVLTVLLVTGIIALCRKRSMKMREKDGFRYKALYNPASQPEEEETAVTIEMTFITDKTRARFRETPPPTDV